MKAAHREYMSAQFDAWIVEHPGQAQDWNPKFTLGAMKPTFALLLRLASPP
jgi:hypothetical protein